MSRAVSERRRRLVDTISFAFRDGSWSAGDMAARGRHDLALTSAPWLDALAEVLVADFPEPPDRRSRDFRQRIAEAVDRSRRQMSPEMRAWLDGARTGFDNAWPRVDRTAETARMARSPWPVPGIDTPVDLAGFLGVDVTQLDWYADVRSLERTADTEDLRHYDYRWRSKRSGGVRLVEAPKQNLKGMQRRILHRVLDHIPAHDAAHGFRAGRSIQSFAAPHTGRHVVVRMDLRNFFASVPAGRVFATYSAAGYPDAVAHLLTGLATNATPADVLGAHGSSQPLDATTVAMLRGPHLPQGAPTSPALANLAAFGLDVRLSALADRFDATYTRYADDLAFSGDRDFDRSMRAFLPLVDRIVREEGFSIQRAKTRLQRAHQRQVLTGMTVNRHLNIDRRELDRLRAQLHEAARHGPAVANRDGHPNFRAHLEGRIGHVQATNVVRARKLWAMFDRISW